MVASNGSNSMITTTLFAIVSIFLIALWRLEAARKQQLALVRVTASRRMKENNVFL
jgi:hypothetical protein